MLEFSIQGIRVKINLNPGVYAMNNKSAIGKTRLGVLLGKYFFSGGVTFYYSYDDYVRGMKLADVLEKRDYSVVMIDRLDMFIQEYSIFEDVDKYRDKTIFLFDLKNVFVCCSNLKFCNVVMSEREIEVR